MSSYATVNVPSGCTIAAIQEAMRAEGMDFDVLAKPNPTAHLNPSEVQVRCPDHRGRLRKVTFGSLRVGLGVVGWRVAGGCRVWGGGCAVGWVLAGWARARPPTPKHPRATFGITDYDATTKRRKPGHVHGYIRGASGVLERGVTLFGMLAQRADRNL